MSSFGEKELKEVLTGKTIREISVTGAMHTFARGNAGSVSILLESGEIVILRVRGGMTSHWISVEINGEQIAST